MTAAPLKNGNGSGTIDLGDYLVTRLKQAGVKQVFGVPGDYQLELLDYFEADPDLEWVGNANELGAAYAADGYARVKGGLAVCVTTFGVGELSALGGIAGAAAERLPVVHIVGSPRSPLQKDGALMHHTLNLPNSYKAYAEMSRPISAAVVTLVDVPETSPHALGDAIDEAIATCLVESRPVYLDIPLDYSHKRISSEKLAEPLPKFGAPKEPRTIARKVDDPPIEVVSKQAIESIVSMFKAAKNPVVLADIYAERYGLRKAVRELVEKTGMRAYCTLTSKSLLDEQAGTYGGSYGGNSTLDAVKDDIESADMVLYIGALKSDTNTGYWTTRLPVENTVEFYADNTKIGTAEYPGTDMRQLVPALIPLLTKAAKEKKMPEPVSVADKVATRHLFPTTKKTDGEVISQMWLWSRMGAWFQDTDVLMCDMGTSAFGMLPMAMPSNAQYQTQCMWGAIGWSVGAALGAGLAARELDPSKRLVLFVGDGSLQLTVQEIGTMVRRGLTPYIFVLNNDGYEIERLIHGPQAKYNDIANWDFTQLLPLFAGRTGVKHETHSVKTQAELQALLEDPEFAVADRIRVIEVFVPRGDCPPVLAHILGKA